MRKLLLGLLLTSPASAQLCPQLQTLTRDPAVAAAHWGVSVTTLEGTSLCAIDDAQLFRPASNAKLFTTAAAFALLGPAHTFTTRVTGRLDAATGTVTGDLTLVGGGDPSFFAPDLPYSRNAPRKSSDDLEDLARQLAAAGVRSVTGDVVGDDTLFPYEPYPQAWAQDDLVWGYGAPVSALTVADNQLRLTVTPVAGHLAGLALEQNGVAYYTLTNQVRTGAAKSASSIQVERTGRALRVYGTIAEDANPDVEQIAIDEPAAYAAMLFRSVLLAHGITVTGSFRASHRAVTDSAGFLTLLKAGGGPEVLTVDGKEAGGSCLQPVTPPTLATHTSAPLAEDIFYTLKASQNLHAELFLHALGRRVFCGQGSAVAGARLVRAFLAHAGVAAPDTLFYDGSGLSDHDLITPRSATQLLVYAATQPWFASYKASLPLGGVDGTLSTRFTVALKGRVFAKTGTLGESRALSGYLTAASGRTVVFAILVDNHLPAAPADRAVTEHMLELIAAAD